MGQSLLTLGALVLLSFTILNMNRGLDESDIGLAQSRYKLEALSLLNEYSEQSSTYYFDEASTDTANSKQLADFTAPDALGMEVNDGGVPDDFDDFNGYVISDTGASGIAYRISFEVDYVTISGSQLVTSANKEYNKRMRICVTDDYTDPLIYKVVGETRVKDSLTVELVNCYWFYN